MILKQFYRSFLAHASYLIADETTKLAAIVDPQRDIQQYLDVAEELGVKIRYIFLTHFHADFLAGHVEIHEKTGAFIYLGARAIADYEFEPVKDGDVVEFGDVRLQVLETPGHTPEGISILVYDLAQSVSEPHAVLTGDTLFVGDVGRPDLLSSLGFSASELAGQLYDSLHGKLLTLPDETLVYPAHGADLVGEEQLSSETVSTIGEQRQTNAALHISDRGAFIDRLLADRPDNAKFSTYDAVPKRRKRRGLSTEGEQELLSYTVDEVISQLQSAAQIVDVRSAAAFAERHWAGSLNVGLNGPFAKWAGTFLTPSTPIIVIADPGQEQEAGAQLARIGCTGVLGYLADGIEALRDRPELVETTGRLAASELAERLQSDKPPLVVDVRSPEEHHAGRIQGSINIPLDQLKANLHRIPSGALVVHCQAGYRSSLAVSLMQRQLGRDVLDLVGGLDTWLSEGWPVAGLGRQTCCCDEGHDCCC